MDRTSFRLQGNTKAGALAGLGISTITLSRSANSQTIGIETFDLISRCT